MLFTKIKRKKCNYLTTQKRGRNTAASVDTGRNTHIQKKMYAHVRAYIFIF